MAEQIALALINGTISQIPASDTIRGSGGGFQKYYIAPLETYLIPVNFSSVITGPLEIDGIIVLDGRLEVI